MERDGDGHGDEVAPWLAAGQRVVDTAEVSPAADGFDIAAAAVAAGDVVVAEAEAAAAVVAEVQTEVPCILLLKCAGYSGRQ